MARQKVDRTWGLTPLIRKDIEEQLWTLWKDKIAERYNIPETVVNCIILYPELPDSCFVWPVSNTILTIKLIQLQTWYPKDMIMRLLSDYTMSEIIRDYKSKEGLLDYKPNKPFVPRKSVLLWNSHYSMVPRTRQGSVNAKK